MARPSRAPDLDVDFGKRRPRPPSTPPPSSRPSGLPPPRSAALRREGGRRPEAAQASRGTAARSRSPRRKHKEAADDSSWTQDRQPATWSGSWRKEEWAKQGWSDEQSKGWSEKRADENAWSEEGSQNNDGEAWSRKRSWSQAEDWSEKWPEQDWKNDGGSQQRNGQSSWQSSWQDDWRGEKVKTEESWKQGKVEKKKELLAQAYISDVPVEFDEEHMNKLHSECHIAESDYPVAIRFLPSKDSTGETCACIARYHSKDALEQVIMRMNGKQVKTRSGKIKRIGVSQAKPAKWMVQAGLAQQAGEGWTPRKVSVQNVPLGYTVEDILQLHRSAGLPIEELPTVYFPPLKGHETYETCSVTCRYNDLSHAMNAMQKIGGQTVVTASGMQKRLMPILVDLNVDEKPEKPQSFRFDEGVDLEGVITHWKDDQAFGFIRPSHAGPDLFVHRREIELPEGEINPRLWTKVLFQALWVPARNKHEARRVRLLEQPDPDSLRPPLPAAPSPALPAPSAPLALPEPAATVPQLSWLTAGLPIQRYERHPGLDYFCQMWDLDAATSMWLTYLHPDVQQELINEYDDSTRMDPPNSEDQVEMAPSAEVLLANVPRGTPHSGLTSLLQRFGQVRGARFLQSGVRAVVTMSSREEAIMAVEDLTYRIPEGWPGNLLACFHHESPPLAAEEIPEGKMLFGVVKGWNHLMSVGTISLFGVGPDLQVPLSALADCQDLTPASAVLFRVAEGPEGMAVKRCLGHPETVRLHRARCSSSGLAVREYGRSLQKRLKLGCPDI